MSDMISVAPGFQYSVNIAYDLNSQEKLRNYIPTKATMQLLEEIVRSTQPSSNDRAHILIGAYGKGKSHIVLAILSLLMKRDISLFEKLIPAAKKNPTLFQLIEDYYASDNKLLPVLITGSNVNLTQAFLLALQQTLGESGLLDIMPETNYQAAIAVIERWKTSYPQTYEALKNAIGEPIERYVKKLSAYDINAYEQFERIYPALTSGSAFNPFVGFDIVQLYSSVVHALRTKGYTGIYVVYDEFSKYLEANIAEASVSDTKMLQDFAEKCNRSGNEQLHLMLISHKEISNYIDKLPKQKVDGWRGVSDRFTHIRLNNNFSQTYEIIESVILKRQEAWKDFLERHGAAFGSLFSRYHNHPIFSDVDENNILPLIEGCYPLHPVSTFILPRLSERVAQNERTLFTFLSSGGVSTLPSFLATYDDICFALITPDLIYDYFDSIFKKELQNGTIHDDYILAAHILEKLPPDSLESKIIKSLSLIYMLEQFEKLKPVKDELIAIYAYNYSPEEVERAITNLIEEEYVVYLKRSNGYLRLKESSGVDIQAKIKDAMAAQFGSAGVKKALNSINFDDAVYPHRYNDAKEMTRYFTFEFIDANEVTEDVDWSIKRENIAGDGVVYAVIPDSAEAIPGLVDKLLTSSAGSDDCVFVIPRTYTSIEYVVKEYRVVAALRDQASGDDILFDEYDVVYEDLCELLRSYISIYTRPETHKATYIYKGRQISVPRKAALSEKLSAICDTLYPDAPVIITEAVNKTEPTPMAVSSRSKIVTGLLRTELEPNLGLMGTGQEVSMMRSTLIRTGILEDPAGTPRLNLKPRDSLVSNMLSIITGFVNETSQGEALRFSRLYDALTSKEHRIGLRKGLIPIYLAAVLHEHKQGVLIQSRSGQAALSNDTLLQIEANPAEFTLKTIAWDGPKQEYLRGLGTTFRDYMPQGQNSSEFAVIASAIRKWYISLPKYTKEATALPNGERIQREYRAFLKAVKQNAGSYDLLFEKVPAAFGREISDAVALSKDVLSAKNYFDNLLNNLREYLMLSCKSKFDTGHSPETLEKKTLGSVVKDWCDKLDPAVLQQLFPDGTERMLSAFVSAGPDEIELISRIAKLATDLRIEDWDSDTPAAALAQISAWKATAEQFHSETSFELIGNATSSYQLTYIDASGHSVTKRFNKVETTKRGRLLHNMIEDALTGMGQAISEQEKRQILMDFLQQLC